MLITQDAIQLDDTDLQDIDIFPHEDVDDIEVLCVCGENYVQK